MSTRGDASRAERRTEDRAETGRAEPRARRAPRLSELEELYRETPVGVCVLTADGRIERANAAFQRLGDRAPEALLGRPLGEALAGPAAAEARAAAERVLRSGRSELGVELRGLGPDDPEGRRSWLLNLHALCRDGLPNGALASFQEITSARRAAEEERQRLAELESVYRNAPVALSFIDPQLRYLRANQALADMNGVGIEEMIGRRYRDLSPETADVAEPFLRRIIEREESIRNVELRARPPIDRESDHVYLLSMDPVRDARGDVVGYTTAVQDVTELRQAQETAARRLEEIETLYRNTPVGLCLFDPELRIVHLNPLFAQLGELPLEEQVGASAHEVLRRDVAEQLIPQLRSVARMGAGFSSEIRAKLPGATVRERVWIANAHPLVSSGGVLTGIVTVLQDVTALVDRQAEIAAIRDHLEEAQHVARFGSWEWNMLSDHIRWSPELYAIFDEDESYEPTIEGIFEHVHPEDQAAFRDQLERSLNDDEPHCIIFRLIRPDGEERRLFAAARLERTELGMPARLLGTCQDLTQLESIRPPARPARSRRGR